MIHSFVGRKRELQMLQELFKKKAASLVVIRGRRRIGKSRLAQEFAGHTPHFIFSGLPPTEKVSAAEQREEFARQIQRELKVPLPRAEDWGDLFWHLARELPKGRMVLILDEISWMGSKDPTFLGKLKIAWDLYFKANPQLVLILCGSVSSWIEANILSSTGFLGRISLDMILEELPLHECNEFWGAEKERVSHLDKLKVLAVTGGVPRYLEEIIPCQSAETNIQRLCFRREGFLFNEFERIFSDLFSIRVEPYKAIVKRLSEGPCELKDIYQALKMEKSGAISIYLDDLATAGFLSHDFTWHLKNGCESKLSHYRLKDNYLRFYLKYVDPNASKIERQEFKRHPQWYSIMGLQFENLVLSNRKSVQQLLGIDSAEIINDNPFFQRKTKDQKGCQIDYLIQTKFGTCYLCEIKFSQHQISKEVIQEVNQKIRSIKLPKNMTVRPVLIHAGGVDEAVVEEEFFSEIIDFKDLLNTPFS